MLTVYAVFYNIAKSNGFINIFTYSLKIALSIFYKVR